MTYRKYPIVTFDWADSSTTHGWNDIEEAGEWECMRCHSVGFLIAEDGEKYVIAASVADESGSKGLRDHPFHCPQAIPKVVVTNFRVLEARG